MIVKHVRPSELTPKQVRSLAQMHHGDYGLLQSWLRAARETDIGTIFLALEDEEVLGWAMLVPDGHTGYWTKARYRRRGVASELIDNMYRVHGKKLLVDWNVNPEFFDHNMAKVAKGSKFYQCWEILRGDIDA